MIPLLFISNDKSAINDYVNKLKAGSMFFEVTPSTKEYSIDDIKNIIKETKIFNPKTRFYYLPDFHLSSIPAQNSFLKLLEEPPANVQFILSTDNKNRLLPTIISRVKIINIVKSASVKLDKDLVEILKQLTEKQNLNIINRSEFSQAKKEEVLNLLSQTLFFFREKLSSEKNSVVIIKEILRLKALLENNNLNPQLTIDQLLIFIWKKYRIRMSL